MSNKQISNYNFSAAEKKWQKNWQENVSSKFKNNSDKEKYYVLEMFPYPSGKLHMGHIRNYTIGDVLARYKRMQGYNVIYPIGWDAFGLPAENAAIASGIHPSVWTHENIATMKEQLKMMGFSHQWFREITTCQPDYYKHEQKIFLDFYKKGIAYRKESMVNWDPVDQTVLSNEQVVDGKGWRSGVAIEKRSLQQWYLRITDYAEELLKELDNLEGNWPEKIINMQRQWIGKSSGAELKVHVKEILTLDKKATQNVPSDFIGKEITFFTTRPETIFGASFIAISPLHPLATELSSHNPEIKAFIERFNQGGTSEAELASKSKEGVFTNLYSDHPIDESKNLPIFIANFVLIDYGTGAIFGCPAHDERDGQFAAIFNLPVLNVIEKDETTGQEIMINSDFLNGLNVEEAKAAAINHFKNLKRNGQAIGQEKTIFRLRDWGVSRQRYWGCPIPVVYCKNCGTEENNYVVPEKSENLPITLPLDIKFDGNGNPLEKHPTWKYCACPNCGKKAVRETDTFDTFFESSWYFIRYLCPDRSDIAFEKDIADKLLPVDQYIGGAEHAVLHLLYARFFTKALRDCLYLNIDEPFKRLLSQGMVCHQAYQTKNGEWINPRQVSVKDGKFYHLESGEELLNKGIVKMSKSKKNVIDPTNTIEVYGADALRLFILSDTPIARDFDWQSQDLEASHRFLNRLWKMIMRSSSLSSDTEKDIELERLTHQTIKQYNEDLATFALNKAITRLYILTNKIESSSSSTSIMFAIETLIKLIYPIAPHFAHEAWQIIYPDQVISDLSWPDFDSNLAASVTVTIGVQVNGKLRGEVTLDAKAGEDEHREAALAIENVKTNIGDKPIKKWIIVPGRIISILV